MSIETQFYLQRNPNLIKFLHENPKYYKYLNRDPNFIFQLEKLMKEKYKLTIPDKIDKFKDKLDMLNTFIDILN
ncbi:MAG: YlbE-like family protein [Bacilli bacterium]|nr:YlbE-like family protein [Bacilli bacterium]